MESPIAINSTNTNNLIATTIAIENSSFAKIGYYYSFDGGLTWSGDENTAVTTTEGDPVVKFDIDGKAYVLYQKFSERALYMRKSTNGGISWLPPLNQNANQVWLESGGNEGVDRPWMSISPIRNQGGFFDIYISYTWLEKDGYGNITDQHASLLKSTDGGVTFTKIKTYSGTTQYYRLGTFIELGPQGDIFFAYSTAEKNHSDVIEITVKRSMDGGISFGSSVTIPVIQVGNVNHMIKDGTVRLDSYPRIATDNSPFHYGRVYVTWASKSNPDSRSEIKIISGEEVGGSFQWGNPTTVVANANENWQPAISVSPDGVLNIFYYSSSPSHSTSIYTYLKYSTNGGLNFTTVTVGDPSGFPIPQVLTFLGDYFGLTTWFGKAYAMWSEYHTDPPNADVQIYFKQINTSEITISGYNKIEVDQEDQGGLTFGKFGKWNQGLFTEYTPPHNFLFQVGSNAVIRSSQEFKQGTFQKFHEWNTGNDVLNHNVFTIDANTQNIVSSFSGANEGITLKNNFLDAPALNPDADEIDFKDPWYIDFRDNQYGNVIRNRGITLAERRHRSSPFYPDYNTIFTNGSDPSHSYQGIFLNESGPPLWPPPYYSVRSSTQDILLYNTGNPSGRYHKFYFQNWTYDPNKIALQTPGSNETAVVFKTSDAVLSANLKGTQLSENSNAYNTNSQRKYVKTDNGYLHCVYESFGQVYYEVSSNNGAS